MWKVMSWNKSKTLSRQHSFHLSLLVLFAVSVMVACSSQPVPLAAKAGTTFSMALSEIPNLSVGFESMIWTADDQRGKLIAKLVNGPGPDTDLVTRYITRTRPDPATSNLVKGPSVFFAFVWAPEQLIALFDIPCEVVAGHYGIEFRIERPVSATEPDDIIPYAEGTNPLSHLEVEAGDGCGAEQFTDFLGFKTWQQWCGNNLKA